MTATSDLQRLGDALQAATAADLATVRPPASAADRRRRRRLIGGLVAAAVAVPGVAVAATALIGTDEVARSLPNGTLALMGTHPTCTTVREGVEFDCTLAQAPTGELGPGAWKGTVEPTVDDTQHVNGGCRALDADGRHWRCFVGEEAVRQHIVGADFLGQSSSGPGVG